MKLPGGCPGGSPSLTQGTDHVAVSGYAGPSETLWEGLTIGWERACIGVRGLLLLGQLLGGVLLLADDGEATLAVEHFWQLVSLIPAILVALGMFVLRYYVGSFAQLYRRRLDDASYLLVSCGTALVLGKLYVLLLA